MSEKKENTLEGWANLIMKDNNEVYTVLAGCDDDCPLCSGEACEFCGAGCWSNVGTCEHGIYERHREPDEAAAKEGR